LKDTQILFKGLSCVPTLSVVYFFAKPLLQAISWLFFSSEEGGKAHPVMTQDDQSQSNLPEDK